MKLQLSAVWVTFLACAASNLFAHGTFELTDGYVGNIHDGNVTFSLTFNRRPDFFKADPLGRQAEGFQFYISTDTAAPGDFLPGPYVSLVRGCEIWTSDSIPIRNDGPPSSDSDSGGWGTVRGCVSFDLDGRTVTFSVPSSVLNVKGPFAYSLLLTTYGAGNATTYNGLSGGRICVPEPCVPEPSSILLSAMGVPAILFCFWLKNPPDRPRFRFPLMINPNGLGKNH